MKILIDTNVALDLLGDRRPFAESAVKVFELCETGKVDGIVSATTITDIYYVLRKFADCKTLHSILEKFLSTVDVGNVTAHEIFESLKKCNIDFEDSVQSECAKSYDADYIITRNVKDFSYSKVQAINPDNFLKKINIY